jgi:hypothetical protein
VDRRDTFNTKQGAKEQNAPEKPSLLTTLQRYLLSLALHGTQEFAKQSIEQLKASEILDERMRKVWILLEKAAILPGFSLRTFIAGMPEELQPFVSEVFLEQDMTHADEDDQEKLEKEWKKTLQTYREQLKRHKLGDVAAKIATLEALQELSKEQQAEYETLLKQL